MAEPEQIIPSEQQEQTLYEFCSNLSSTDGRVELISAFNHSEKLAGRIKDMPGNYQFRFNAFVSQPV